MAWNSGNNKSLQSAMGQEKKALSVGAPVVYNPGKAGKPYHDGWNIERAYKEGVASVTWVMRAIDAIAGNQARLPMQLRKDNSYDGEIVTRDSTNLLEVLNSVANMGESAFAFRYRLSSQLLMSTRGVFVEVTRNNAGKIDSLRLLPPQDTSPIPDVKNFVRGFEVEIDDGEKKFIKAENVVWIRKPHPLDPYRSITPLEAAGIAIEMEQLAKLYNRNFLQKDGRPGGLLILQGMLDVDDRDELESRFRGGPRAAGDISVIAAEDGGNFLDLGASPRDMAWTEMRSVTKEEILAAFGVPESIIGNASGRTFSNAAEEGRVFWQETMSPHLQLIARSFDPLAKDDVYADFNTEAVPILILSKQEREQFVMQEFNAGLITANEYRDSTGKEGVESDLADSMLANPNLTPIGNTKREMPYVEPQGPEGAGGPQPAGGLGGDGQVPIDVTQGNFPIVDSSQDPTIFEGVPDDAAQLQDVSAGAEKSLQTKGSIEVDTKALDDVDRWQGVFEKTISRFLERQQRVVTEKARGKKVAKAIESGNVSASMVFDSDVWCKQLDEDLRPVIYGAYEDAAKNMGVDFDDVDKAEMKQLADEQIERACKLNQTTENEIATALFVAKGLKDETPDERRKFFYLAVGAIYVKAESDRKEQIAENEAFTAYNSGTYAAGQTLSDVDKTWVTLLDDRVRKEHAKIHGKTVKFDDTFPGGMRFPGDPLAPPEQTINCRCLLTFDI